MKISFYISIFVFAASVMFSCKNEEKKDEVAKEIVSKEDLKASIDSMKDSLMMMSKEKKKIDNLYRIELINRLLSFYHSYPEDEYSAECLNETQMIYSMLEAYEYSAAYSDTLLEKYPKYKGRALVLENQGANYDIFISPRDSSKVRKYYSMLLKEYPSLDKDKREGILKRLKKNDLTFDEYISSL